MSSYNLPQAPAAYPGPILSYPPPAFVAPPPAGYPVKDDKQVANLKPETKSRGEGFWEGCCAALCCCCVLDCCF